MPSGPDGLWDLSPVLFQAELDSRADSISLARSTGQRLLAAGHLSDPDLREALAGLDQELNGLEGTWQEHQLQLQQALELQVGASILPPPLGPALTPPLTAQLAGKSCLPWTHSAEPGPGSLVSPLGHEWVHATCSCWAVCYFLLPFPFLPVTSELCGAGGELALQPGSMRSQGGSGGRCWQE